MKKWDEDLEKKCRGECSALFLPPHSSLSRMIMSLCTGEAEFDFWKWKTSLELSPQIGFLKTISVAKQAILNVFSI